MNEQIAPIRKTGAPSMELTQRHQAPTPNASTVEKVMKTIWNPFRDILASDRIVPGEIGQPKESKDEEESKNQDAIDHPFLRGEMHEDCSDEARFEGGHDHRDCDVGLLRSEIDVGKGDGDSGKKEKRPADHEITTNVFRDIVSSVLVVRYFFAGGSGGCLGEDGFVRFVHRLEQVKERENEDPDQIDKVPE